MHPETPNTSIVTVDSFESDLSLGSARIDRNPAVVYLKSLTVRSRPTMEWSLRRAVRIFSRDKKDDPFVFPWHTMRIQHMQALRSELIDRGVALGTANKILVAVRKVIETCFELNLVSNEDYTRLRGVKAIKGSRVAVGRMLSQQELDAFYAATEKNTIIGMRDRAALVCLEYGGLRRLELSLVTMDMWDRTENSFRVMGKGNKERVVPLTATARSVLEEWAKVRGPHDGPIVHPVAKGGNIMRDRPMSPSTTYALLKRLAKIAGIKRVSPHDFRRTLISTMLERGADISVVADFVGHASTDTTRKYDRRGDKAKRLASDLLEHR